MEVKINKRSNIIEDDEKNLYETDNWIVMKRFISWLDSFGETSQDQYDFWATRYGIFTKFIYYKNPKIGGFLVAPIVLLDTLLPCTRALVRTKSRFPIADAHYAMAFCLLYKATGDNVFYRRAIHFIEVLLKSSCKGYKHLCWGYPFNWETSIGTIKAGTPLVTVTPYVYEAFEAVYEIEKQKNHLSVMRSIADFLAEDIKDYEFSKKVASCSYSPFDKLKVINANAYRSYILLNAAKLFSNIEYEKIAMRNLNFILQSQQPDGSWYYAMDSGMKFIDNFHSCFVLKSLTKILNLTNDRAVLNALEKGVKFHLEHLLDKTGLPIPYAKIHRILLHKRELYDYAENINIAVLLRTRFSKYNDILKAILIDLYRKWLKPDGSFRTRKMLFGWNNVPYHRWAQSQLFRSLCYLYYDTIKK